MTTELHVYDVTNTTKLGELSKAHGIGWFADLRDPGTMVFSVDVVSTVDRALLEPFRIVRVNVDAVDIEAFIVQDTPAELAVLDERPVVTYQLRHLLTWLGYQQGGAVLWPYGGLDGLQQSPRWFGPMSFDFPAVVRPEPTTDGPLTRAGWPDPRAERFVFDDKAVYRRLLTGNPSLIGDTSRMFFTAASWTEARVWFDGAELTALSKPVGDRSVRIYDLPYDGEDHVVFIDARGTPPAGSQNSLGWTWALVEENAAGEIVIGNRLFTTFNSTTYSGPTAPTAPFWQAWEDYTDYPGVTVGFVEGTAIDEAQARGLLPGLTYDFDFDDDSDGVAWTEFFSRAFRMQKLGPLLDSLAPFRCEPEMTPAGVLRLHQARGTDLSASITVTTPYRLAVTGRGPQATRYLYETEGGFGQAIAAAAEAALGVKLEDVAQLGEDIDPDTIADAIAAQLELDAGNHSEISVDLPTTVVPYVDVELGDVVACTSDADGTVADVRLTSFRGSVVEKSIEWSAIGEPV